MKIIGGEPPHIEIEGPRLGSVISRLNEFYKYLTIRHSGQEPLKEELSDLRGRLESFKTELETLAQEHFLIQGTPAHSETLVDLGLEKVTNYRPGTLSEHINFSADNAYATIGNTILAIENYLDEMDLSNYQENGSMQIASYFNTTRLERASSFFLRSNTVGNPVDKGTLVFSGSKLLHIPKQTGNNSFAFESSPIVNEQLTLESIPVTEALSLNASSMGWDSRVINLGNNRISLLTIGGDTISGRITGDHLNYPINAFTSRVLVGANGQLLIACGKPTLATDKLTIRLAGYEISNTLDNGDYLINPIGASLLADFENPNEEGYNVSNIRKPLNTSRVFNLANITGLSNLTLVDSSISFIESNESNNSHNFYMNISLVVRSNGLLYEIKMTESLEILNVTGVGKVIRFYNVPKVTNVLGEDVNNISCFAIGSEFLMDSTNGHLGYFNNGLVTKFCNTEYGIVLKEKETDTTTLKEFLTKKSPNTNYTEAKTRVLPYPRLNLYGGLPLRIVPLIKEGNSLYYYVESFSSDSGLLMRENHLFSEGIFRNNTNSSNGFNKSKPLGAKTNDILPPCTLAITATNNPVGVGITGMVFDKLNNYTGVESIAYNASSNDIILGNKVSFDSSNFPKIFGFLRPTLNNESLTAIVLSNSKILVMCLDDTREINTKLIFGVFSYSLVTIPGTSDKNLMIADSNDAIKVLTDIELPTLSGLDIKSLTGDDLPTSYLDVSMVTVNALDKEIVLLSTGNNSLCPGLRKLSFTLGNWNSSNVTVTNTSHVLTTYETPVFPKLSVAKHLVDENGKFNALVPDYGFIHNGDASNIPDYGILPTGLEIMLSGSTIRLANNHHIEIGTQGKYLYLVGTLDNFHTEVTNTMLEPAANKVLLGEVHDLLGEKVFKFSDYDITFKQWKLGATRRGSTIPVFPDLCGDGDPIFFRSRDVMSDVTPPLVNNFSIQVNPQDTKEIDFLPLVNPRLPPNPNPGSVVELKSVSLNGNSVPFTNATNLVTLNLPNVETVVKLNKSGRFLVTDNTLTVEQDPYGGNLIELNYGYTNSNFTYSKALVTSLHLPSAPIMNDFAININSWEVTTVNALVLGNARKQTGETFQSGLELKSLIANGDVSTIGDEPELLPINPFLEMAVSKDGTIVLTPTIPGLEDEEWLGEGNALEGGMVSVLELGLGYIGHTIVYSKSVITNVNVTTPSAPIISDFAININSWEITTVNALTLGNARKPDGETYPGGLELKALIADGVVLAIGDEDEDGGEVPTFFSINPFLMIEVAKDGTIVLTPTVPEIPEVDLEEGEGAEIPGEDFEIPEGWLEAGDALDQDPPIVLELGLGYIGYPIVYSEVVITSINVTAPMGVPMNDFTININSWEETTANALTLGDARKPDEETYPGELSIKKVTYDEVDYDPWVDGVIVIPLSPGNELSISPDGTMTFNENIDNESGNIIENKPITFHLGYEDIEKILGTANLTSINVIAPMDIMANDFAIDVLSWEERTANALTLGNVRKQAGETYPGELIIKKVTYENVDYDLYGDAIVIPLGSGNEFSVSANGVVSINVDIDNEPGNIIENKPITFHLGYEDIGKILGTANLTSINVIAPMNITMNDFTISKDNWNRFDGNALTLGNASKQTGETYPGEVSIKKVTYDGVDYDPWIDGTVVIQLGSGNELSISPDGTMGINENIGSVQGNIIENKPITFHLGYEEIGKILGTANLTSINITAHPPIISDATFVADASSGTETVLMTLALANVVKDESIPYDGPVELVGVAYNDVTYPITETVIPSIIISPTITITATRDGTMTVYSTDEDAEGNGLLYGNLTLLFGYTHTDLNDPSASEIYGSSTLTSLNMSSLELVNEGMETIHRGRTSGGWTNHDITRYVTGNFERVELRAKSGGYRHYLKLSHTVTPYQAIWGDDELLPANSIAGYVQGHLAHLGIPENSIMRVGLVSHESKVISLQNEVPGGPILDAGHIDFQICFINGSREVRKHIRFTVS